MPATPPKPAYVAPAPSPVLRDVEIISGGRVWHIPVASLPCNSLAYSTVVKTPSLQQTAVLSCNGAPPVVEVSDDPTSAPVGTKR